jgi:hypothetical protein
MVTAIIGFVLLALGIVALVLSLKQHMTERLSGDNRNYYKDIDDCASFPLLLAGYISGTIFTIIGLVIFLVGIFSI